MTKRNSAYSPLPLSNSDSEDTSEELHLDEKNQIADRVTKPQNNGPEQNFLGQKAKTINYKLLDSDVDIEAALIRFQSPDNEVSVVKPNNKVELFSTSRKICFFLSLLLCVFTTVIFIWLLPCNVGTCLSPLLKSKTIAWEHLLDNSELFGPIGVFPDASSTYKNLVFLTRKNFLNNITVGGEKKFGMISLNGLDGKERWNITLDEEVRDLDCNMIDVNLDGINDCLIAGVGFLKLINAASGSELWDAYKASKKGMNLQLLDFPLVIYDVNGDGVNDLVSSSLIIFKLKAQNHLIIISGKTGEILNAPLKIKMCSTINNLTIRSNHFISYKCSNDTKKESLELLHMRDLLKTLVNLPANKLDELKWNHFHEHSKYFNSVSINGYRVIVDNQGQCPGNCSSAVDIKNEKSGSENDTVYTYNDKNTYCIIPAVLKSQSPKTIVLKFLKWQSRSSISRETKREIPAKGMISYRNLVNSTPNTLDSKNGLFNEMLASEDESPFRRAKRGVGHFDESVPEISEHLISYLHIVSETLVSITFNRSQPLVKNLVQHKLYQICRSQKICEPDFHRQKRSLLTVDINGDGKEEFVSFSSGYSQDVQGQGNKVSDDKWILRSSIKVATVS